MKALVLIVLNGGLIIFFIYLLRQKGLLTYSHQGRIWLTWLAIAIITLMDEFTSIFYVPAILAFACRAGEVKYAG